MVKFIDSNAFSGALQTIISIFLIIVAIVFITVPVSAAESTISDSEIEDHTVVYVVPAVILVIIIGLIFFNIRRRGVVIKNKEGGTMVIASGEGAQASGPITITKNETHIVSENNSRVTNVTTTNTVTTDNSVHENNSINNSNVADGQALMTDTHVADSADRRCPSCGNPIGNTDRFCPACGNKV